MSRKIIKADSLYIKGKLTPAQLERRELALNDLQTFIELVAPYNVLADCHKQLCKWMTTNPKVNKLVLWPRDHQKSRMAAFFAAWQIVRNPAVTIIYASATASKAEEQLRFIKTILTSDVVFQYFPKLINEREGTRALWNNTNIIVDHPYRFEEGVVDSTIMTCGLEKTIQGKHCEFLIMDDIVVKDNNTTVGRRDVNSWVSNAASIMSTDSEILAIGTRHHPKDAYGMMIDMEYEVEGDTENEDEESKELEPLFLVNQANVEENGEFLWPRQQRKDGKWFGFNQQILNKKRAVYVAAGDLIQFYAQYYNDPNDSSTAPIGRDLFQYYAKNNLEYRYGCWEIDIEDGSSIPLSVYAAVDLAATVGDKSDFTVIVVGGIDAMGNRYLLEIERYQTDKISVTLGHLKRLYNKYTFKKLRIEAVGGFRLVAQDLADNLIDSGIRIPIDIYIPPSGNGKLARVNGILEPLYQAKAVFHPRGGYTHVLEEELTSINPPNDDTKDAWAMCCDLMELPKKKRQDMNKNNVLKFHPRFGGVAI